MKLWEIFRFEVGYQARRPWTWVYFVVLLAITLQFTVESYTGNARDGGYYFNAPFVVLAVTILASAMGLLVTAAVAGDAAARDVQTRMHPLVYTASLSEGTYLGGRFLAAFALSAALLVAPQLALLLSPFVPWVPRELVGPFRPGAYVAAYLAVALPNAFVGAALLFAVSALTRRAIAGYVGAVLLFATTLVALLIVARKLQLWELAKLVDPLGVTVLSEIRLTTTPGQKNALSVAALGPLLLNRVVWAGIALAALALTRARFRFRHVTARTWGRVARREDAPPQRVAIAAESGPIAVPRVRRATGLPARAHQTLAIAAQSFREIAFGWGGLVLVALSAILVVFGRQAMTHLGIPQLPTTHQMTDWVGNTGEIIWMIVPLLTAFYVGELVWRDRETGLSEISDAVPAPEWTRFLGQFLGLALVLAAYQALLVLACIGIQAQLGYHELELGLYARVMLGLALTQHLLFAAMAFAVHVLVNQKYAGHMVLALVYGFGAMAPSFGVNQHLLVFGASPDWTYSDMRGFGTSVAPWAWFKLYWAAWAFLLAVAARLFWVRGKEQGLAARLRLARRRLTRPAAGAAAAAGALVVTLGAFILYNTHVLNAYETAPDRAARRAEYERRYRRFDGAPQPRLTGITLRAELYPGRRAAEIRGTYHLTNLSGVAIDSLHLAPDWDVETGPATLDRPATLVIDDPALGHRTYALATPLAPGDSLRVDFTLRFRPRGFTNAGVDPSVTRGATFFESNDWLPGVGYQRALELAGAGERRAQGLPPRRAVRALEDTAARRDVAGAERVAVETIVGTDAGQTAVAPGALRRTWTEHGRRYFHYATDVPIRNDFALFSARYAVRRARWEPPPSAGSGARPVDIEVLHHPAHTENVDRIVRGARASLDHFTKHLGPYPYGQLRFVERPGDSPTLHGSPVNVNYEEGFDLLNADADPRRIDFPFAVAAHEMAHQWWGNQLTPADVEGAPLLSEALAWHSALSVVRETYGDAHLQRVLAMMREMYLDPRSRAAAPLLRTYTRFDGYRKGPFAMHAVREYVGDARVNGALRRLLARFGTGAPPLPTSLDLYRELQAVTPDSLRPLLADLFEANTYWELSTKRAAAAPDGAGGWRVTLDVLARKVVVDTLGAEREVPMDDIVEIGVYAAARDGEAAAPLYLRTHRVRAGAQRITVTVPREPGRAGIDPRNLLIDAEPGDNVADVARSDRLRAVAAREE